MHMYTYLTIVVEILVICIYIYVIFFKNTFAYYKTPMHNEKYNCYYVVSI